MKTRYIKYLALPLMLASAWSCTDMTEHCKGDCPPAPRAENSRYPYGVYGR